MAVCADASACARVRSAAVPCERVHRARCSGAAWSSLSSASHASACSLASSDGTLMCARCAAPQNMYCAVTWCTALHSRTLVCACCCARHRRWSLRRSRRRLGHSTPGRQGSVSVGGGGRGKRGRLQGLGYARGTAARQGYSRGYPRGYSRVRTAKQQQVHARVRPRCTRRDTHGLCRPLHVRRGEHAAPHAVISRGHRGPIDRLTVRTLEYPPGCLCRSLRGGEGAACWARC